MCHFLVPFILTYLTGLNDRLDKALGSVYKVEMDRVGQQCSLQKYGAMGVVIVQCRRSSAVSSVRNADWSYFTVTLTVVLSSSTAQ